ncbi:extracellular solute-binding protein, partial [candidate division KSB3 bacterium]|nr:extracellular solute-binding protein [candidate division KSB3 bacterium]
IMARWTGYFAWMGALKRLDTLLNQDNLDKRFYEKDLYGGIFRDKLYSVAWGLCPVALIANKNVLRETGITLPDSPMTLDTFRAICQQIDQFYGQREKYSYALSLSSDKETDFLTMYCFLQAFKGGCITEQGEIIFDSAENVAAFTWLREFVKNCRIFTSDILTIRERFAHNDIAFMSDGPWMKYVLEDVTGREFNQDFEIVLNPVHSDSHSSSWNDNYALAICSQTPYAAYAAKFIDALTNEDEIFKYYTSETGLLPVNKSSLNDPLYDTDFFKGYKQQLAHAACIYVQNAIFTRATYFCMDAVKKILYEGADIEQELHEKAYYLKMLYSE